MSEVRHTTGIQWTHRPGTVGATWNPTTGCTRVSPGCDHCYAFQLHDQRYKVNRDAARALGDIYAAASQPAELARSLGERLPMAPQYDVPFSTVQLLDERRLTEPLRARKPHTYFVDSMSDLGHPDVPDEFLDRVFAVMALSPQHTFLILTKRPWRMREYVQSAAIRVLQASGDTFVPSRLVNEIAMRTNVAGWQWPLPNVWLGVSVEDQERADERIPLLLDTPAAIRFLSCEPLLGPLEFSDVTRRSDAVEQLGRPAMDGIDWVIVGGESGPHARPMDVAWARSLRDQCAATGTAFFMKQMGAHVLDRNDVGFWGDSPDEWPEGTRVERQRALPRQGELLRVRLRNPHGSDPDEWPEDLRVRQWPEVRS